MTDFDALAQIDRQGKVRGAKREQREAIAIAHGFAYDPQVEGRLRLTIPGRKRLNERPERQQGSLL